uniref:PNPLA domain-containing protein n=1 Tax=viral metagenome TaxID=1070528 RepID=A0A6C0ANE6_9ZZZZ
MKKIPPRFLVISGGGIKVISIVGTLKALEGQGVLKNIKEISGVSAGAWLAFMLSAGLSIETIEALVLGFEFSVIRNLKPETFIGFPETFGLDDGTNLIKFVESIFKVAIKIDPSVTFREFNELKRSNIQFRCWATDLKEETTCEFSFKKTPDVKILDALRASMALPLYFTPVTHPISGNLLTDGGIQGNLPLHLLSESERRNCLGIGFEYSDSSKNNPSDLMGFVSSLFACLIHSRHENVLKKLESSIIRIPIHDTVSWDFEISREQRTKLLKNGYDSGLKWLSNKLPKPIIIRRHSVQ